MNHDAEVAEEGRVRRVQRGVQVGELGPEGAGALGDGAVLAAQVAHLARLGGFGVARGLLAALVGVQVRPSRGAVAIIGDGTGMDVVVCCLGRC